MANHPNDWPAFHAGAAPQDNGTAGASSHHRRSSCAQLDVHHGVVAALEDLRCDAEGEGDRGAEELDGVGELLRRWREAPPNTAGWWRGAGQPPHRSSRSVRLSAIR